MSNLVSDVEMIEAGAARERGEVFTCTVGKVHAVLGNGLVDVEPMIKRPVESLSQGVIFEELPIVPNVRIVFMQAAGATVTFKVQAGDTGLLLGLTWSADDWLRTGEKSNASDVRLHHLGSAVFIPGISPEQLTPQYADDPDYVIDADMVRIPGAATEFAGRSDKIATRLNAIENKLNSVTYLPGPGAATLLFPVSLSLTTADDVACEGLKLK